MANRFCLVFSVALVVGLTPLSAEDLSLLFPSRYLEGVYSSQEGARFEAFTGDYPYRLRLGSDQLAVYTGIPLYFPLMGSLGSVNQLGYKDDYSISTPLALLTGGYQWNAGLLDVKEGPFALWGWRWGALSGGASYRFASGEVALGLGWFSPAISLFATASAPLALSARPTVQAKVRLPLLDSWSLVLGAERPTLGPSSWSLGLGSSLYEAPANTLTQVPWDHQIAHRGSLLRAPENTLPAVELALREGEVEGVELDVQKTMDGTYVFVHDDFLFRYNGTFERVIALSGRELEARDFGGWFSQTFAGTRPMVMEDLAPLATKAPLNRWVFDIKNIGFSPAEAAAFLASVDHVLPDSSPAIVSTGDTRLLRSLEPLSPYPLGLQIDVARVFFLFGDFFPPLLEWELDSLVKENKVSAFFLFSSKYANATAIHRVAERNGLTFYLWNFHDRIYGLDP